MDFHATLTAAVNDFIEHGFDSQERLDRWMSRLHDAAKASLVPEAVLARSLAQALDAVFKRNAGTAKLMKVAPGVSQYTIEMIKPKLRAELDRRKLASASLIKLNRHEAIAKTLQRFAGWASSVPKGGTEIAKRQDIKTNVRKGIAALPFLERRVIIDQSAKLVATINNIVATDGGAIALIWRHVKMGPPEYQSRPEHVERDGEIFLIRDSWAHKAGYVKLAGRQYYDQVDAVGEAVYCSCSAQYLFALRDLPAEMLTVKGREALLQARRALAGKT